MQIVIPTAIGIISKMPLQSRVRQYTQTAVMCVCFQRRHVRHNANYVPDRREFARKVRNLLFDVHVIAENQHTILPFGNLDSFWMLRTQRSRRRDKGIYIIYSMVQYLTISL